MPTVAAVGRRRSASAVDAGRARPHRSARSAGPAAAARAADGCSCGTGEEGGEEGQRYEDHGEEGDRQEGDRLPKATGTAAKKATPRRTNSSQNGSTS